MSELKQKRTEFFQPDNILVDSYARKIELVALGIYIVLKRHSNARGVCWPTQELIAEKLNLSTRTVARHIKKLEKYGLIVSLKKRRSGKWENYQYYLPERDDWMPLVEPSDNLSTLVDVTSTTPHRMTTTTPPYDNLSDGHTTESLIKNTNNTNTKIIYIPQVGLAGAESADIPPLVSDKIELEVKSVPLTNEQVKQRLKEIGMELGVRKKSNGSP